MALIKLGGLAQDVRGTLNGSVFSRNRGGAFIRSKVSPCQPMSRWSAQSRAIFKAISQRWSTYLNDGQRSSWQAFADLHPIVNVFGDSIKLSGLAFYQSINARLAQLGYAYIDNPPLTFVVEDPGILTIGPTATPPALHCSVQVERSLGTHEGLMIFMSGPLGPGRTLQAGDLRCINSANQVAFGSPVDLSPDIAARYPQTTWRVGDRFGLRLQIVDTSTGATSAPVGGIYTAIAP